MNGQTCSEDDLSDALEDTLVAEPEQVGVRKEKSIDFRELREDLRLRRVENDVRLDWGPPTTSAAAAATGSWSSSWSISRVESATEPTS